MIAIQIRFEAGRYHANPWGRHVNEGVPEWPPSPYRLLRALYDTWKRKCAHLDSETVKAVLQVLGGQYPLFSLPTATASHTRSYLSANSQDPTDKSLVFDAFLVFQPGANTCQLAWPDAILTETGTNALAELLTNLNFLGRSESWVSAALFAGELPDGGNCLPADVATYDGEVVPVACVVPPANYPGPRPWMDALTTSTTEVIKQRLSGPPLLRRVSYKLRRGAIELDPVTRLKRKSLCVQAVMLGLDSKVLPLATETIEIASQIRIKLMGAHKRRMDGDGFRVSSLFSGKNFDGTLRDDHGHLYILPVANRVGRIDRVFLVSRRGSFDKDELDAIYGVRQLYNRSIPQPIRCAVSWQGSLDDKTMFPPASVVVSTTPFIPARHWRRGRDPEAFLFEEVLRECSNHGIPEPTSIARIDSDMPIGLYHSVEYRRSRKDDSPRTGYAFRLTFAAPIAVPFAIGYYGHFGMGQFSACEI
jgi:CRISPR-associated protein Csb2